MKLTEIRILTNTCIAKSTYLLTFQRHFDFIPGQVVGISNSHGQDPRLYSIASGNKDKNISILYKVNPEGLLTPDLQHLQTGAPLLVTEPFGTFTGNDEPAWWIANGTGVAPFVSMFFSGMTNNKTLIHGNREAESFFFSHEFSTLLSDHYIKCSTVEKIEGFYQGRLTDYLARLKEIPVSIKYYLCGSAEMVVDTRDLLISRGIPFDNIISEIYF
ncbi:MAG: oxidoreductase [Bacteroidia bacterium]|nr:oxidoreductase [Bacteroidia bacterium]